MKTLTTQNTLRAAPDEITIWPPGWVETTKYEPFLVDAAAADSIISAFSRLGRDLPIDYEHQTLGGEWAAPDGKAPAAGWVKALRWDAERGLIARVEWTTRGREFVEAGEYRYFSPTFTVREKDARVASLSSVALTNDPATLNIKPLVARGASTACGRRQRVASAGAAGVLQLLGLQDTANVNDIAGAITDDNRSMVAALLGLEDSASREDCMREIGRMVGVSAERTDMPDEMHDDDDKMMDSAAEGAAKATAATVREVATALGLDDVKDESVSALIASAKNRLANPPVLKAALDSANARIASLEKEAARARFDQLVSSGENAGKVPPADADKMFKLFCSDRETFDMVLSRLPAKVAAKTELSGSAAPAGASEFDAAVNELVTKEKLPRLEAMKRVARERPELYGKQVNDGNA